MKKLMLIAGAAVVAMISGAHAEGDAAAGEKVFRKCKACHMVGEKAKNRVGPVLNGVVGREVATVGDYKYSKGMMEFGEGGKVWDEETLMVYLMDPRGTVKGTKMAFAGLKKEEDVNNVIAYLEQFDANGAESN
ncbi:c-type cytochrome [Stappia sp. GBMRC 2046]|uniref:C-type cytochrome n=1 Tax=Stappia sediminis TaxID=2692190 RepID=A0A7X3S8T0_9HYPH|nr:cytochrome c family protein [Stappia sediminis]MXN66196.1 c-type cytochrome [Stappia sediminis]